MEIEHIIKILIAFAAGTVLGVEREFRSKPAGFRTMILICVGATVFTILSNSFSSNQDRIASNIVTGIGFIGAGVIFKEGVSVRGITSAATIWIAAAVGMAIGLGFYTTAIVVLVIVISTLVILMRLEEVLDRFHQIKIYSVTFCVDNYSLDEMEQAMNDMNITFSKTKITKKDNDVVVFYKIEGRQHKHEEFSNFLIACKSIISFEVG